MYIALVFLLALGRAAAGTAAESPVRVLVLTGNDGPFHPWQEKTDALRDVLGAKRFADVEVSLDIEDLARTDLKKYDVLVLNYVNWKRPEGLSEPAKRAFVGYLRAGGGLIILHFSNGAWHPSLPEAGASAWPEYRRICLRVWDETRGSSHDNYGAFTVTPTAIRHAITAGMKPWPTTDELYFAQAGDQPITPLLTARSRKTGRDEPMAWTHRYGKGRVFQTLLGHDGASIRAEGTALLLRRSLRWAAGR